MCDLLLLEDGSSSTFTIVQDMSRVEIMDIQLLCNIRGDLVQFPLNAVLDRIK